MPSLGQLLLLSTLMAVVPCQGPSHGGSYMDESTFCIRIRLLPYVVPGDHLASFSSSMPPLLLARAYPMSDDPGLY